MADEFREAVGADPARPRRLGWKLQSHFGCVDFTLRGLGALDFGGKGGEVS